MSNQYFIAFIIGITLFTSCKKAEDRTCLKSTGKETIDTLALPEFTALILKQNIDFHLVPDSANFAILKGGEHLLKKIAFEPIDTSIVVTDKNKCNFLRTYKKHIYVEIHFKQLNRLEFMGSYPISNEDTLRAGIFNFLLHKGSATVTLTVKANSCNGIISEGVGDFFLSGSADFATILIQDNGYCDATKFSVRDYLEVENNSTGILKCFPDNADFVANITSTGDIWYVGTPSSITEVYKGTGQIIHK